MHKQLQDLLSINRNFIVKGIKVQGTENTIHLEWKRKQHICPECGRRVRHLHQNHGTRKILHEIGSDGKRIYLDVPNLRGACISCGKIFTLRSQGTFAWSRVTAHMLVSIFDRLKRLSFKQVAEWAGMSQRTLLRKTGEVFSVVPPNKKNSTVFQLSICDKF
jgi:transposase